MNQSSLEFDDDLLSLETPRQLWTPRDIWSRLNQRALELLGEDRRFERKNHSSPDLDNLATYYSMFSNTPDGGVFVYGVSDEGTVTGCNFSDEQLNKIETFHFTRCVGAKPEFKRIPVIVDGKKSFCLAIFCPYVGTLVETNKGEAWIRYGESRRKMSEEEKQDFRSTRRELSFELALAPLYTYPGDFDLKVIQDFCDAFRTRELKPDWTNEEVLVDRYLLNLEDGVYIPRNSLVLMASHRPALSIPGCRVRVQRFDTIEEGSGESYSPIRDRVIEGNLVRILQEAQDVISSIIFDVTWLNKEGKFVTTPEYPKWAWFEALVNACVHRSYSFSGTEVTVKLFPDRMEIESPGGFVPPVNEQTIYFTRASRNHHLMDALRFLGYVRMSREGIRRIRDSMHEFQLPDPVFRQETLHGVVVKVVLRNDYRTKSATLSRSMALHFGEEVWGSLSERDIKLVSHAFYNGKIRVSDAQRLTGRTWPTSKKDLERLVDKGILKFETEKAFRDPKSHYKLVRPPKA